jgi:hypothetical protein
MKKNNEHSSRIPPPNETPGNPDKVSSEKNDENSQNKDKSSVEDAPLKAENV